jgi:hypothetical protein
MVLTQDNGIVVLGVKGGNVWMLKLASTSENANLQIFSTVQLVVVIVVALVFILVSFAIYRNKS